MDMILEQKEKNLLILNKSHPAVIGQDEEGKNVNSFLSIFKVVIYVLGPQKNCLIEYTQHMF